METHPYDVGIYRGFKIGRSQFHMSGSQKEYFMSKIKKILYTYNYIIQTECGKSLGILCGILSGPQNIVMNVNNVMHVHTRF